MKQVILETERLILKSPLNVVTPMDIVNAIDHEETKKYLSSVPSIYTEETAKSFLGYLTAVKDSQETIQLGIFEKISERFIGMVTLESINHKDSSCELGYWISKDFTGKGLAFEAAYKMLEYAVKDLGIKTVKAYVIKEHEKSIGLLKRLGFKEKELLVNNVENKGQLVDRFLYVLNKDTIDL